MKSCCRLRGNAFRSDVKKAPKAVVDNASDQTRIDASKAWAIMGLTNHPQIHCNTIPRTLKDIWTLRPSNYNLLQSELTQCWKTRVLNLPNREP